MFVSLQTQFSSFHAALIELSLAIFSYHGTEIHMRALTVFGPQSYKWFLLASDKRTQTGLI